MRESWLFKVVPVFIGFVFVAIVSFWIIAGVVLFKGAKEIQSKGLKNFVETIWCGESK